MQLYDMSAVELMYLLRDRKVSSVEITKCFLKRIEKENERLGAYITICEDVAIQQAEAADRRIARGEMLDVTGLPISVKDNICTAGVKTTCGSKMLQSFVPSYDATVVEKLTSAGAVILGKVNMDEFAVGASGELSALLSTINPINSEYVPGGSSSGSAASVAAGLCVASVCSDTGGSVRVPASCCGLVGFKPSWGGISRYGLIAYASSLEQIGVIAKTVPDITLFSGVMFGADPRDVSTHEVEKPSYEMRKIFGLRFAFSDEFLKTADAEITATVTNVSELMCRAGAHRVDAKISMYSDLSNVYRVIASAELSSNLARFDAVKYGYLKPGASNVTVDSRSASFGREVKKRILIGNYVLSEENFSKVYEKACRTRDKIAYELDSIFESADVILAPVSDSTVGKCGESVCDGCESYRSDIHTVAANLAGLPAVSIPAGRDKNGMPISVQLMSRRFSDKELISVAASLEKLLEGDDTHGL